MKFLKSLLVAVLLSGVASVQAAEAPKYVSATFQDILRRVSERDKTSGAILRVKAKSDSPRGGFNLNFSIKQERDPDEVVISLSWNNKIDDGIDERYRLTKDDAMVEELQKQQHYHVVLAERARQWQEERARRIEKTTAGKLKFGMSQADVKAIKGTPPEVEHPPVAMVNADVINWVYPDLKLYFTRGALQDAEAIK